MTICICENKSDKNNTNNKDYDNNNNNDSKNNNNYNKSGKLSQNTTVLPQVITIQEIS